jgi:2-deoxy-D-gluconate 3-dehydrogenase
VPHLFDVKNQVALVTGGRRGLGRAMALALMEAGARVAVVARSADSGDLEARAADLGIPFLYLARDLAARAQREDVIGAVVDHFGQLDILVNNAGLQQRAPLLDYAPAQWDADLALMLTAVFELAQQAGRHMVPRRRGKIVNIASISSFQGARGIVGYATAKHGLIGLTKCLANELAPHGVNVNGIAPGLFETDMAAHVMADDAKTRELKGRIPAGEFGKPEDLIGPLLFLVSGASRHVHGHTLLVDGGWMGR